MALCSSNSGQPHQFPYWPAADGLQASGTCETCSPVVDPAGTHALAASELGPHMHQGTCSAARSSVDARIRQCRSDTNRIDIPFDKNTTDRT